MLSPKSLASRGVTARSVLIGLFCAIFFCAFTPYNDFKVAATYIAGTQFPVGALFVVFVLSFLVNPLVRRFAPARAFSKGEILTVWSLILVASGLPSSGMMRYFVPHIVFLRYASDSGNGWEDKVWKDIPDLLKFPDKAAADAFFKGYSLGQERIPWDAWVQPLAVWIPLALLFLLATFCLSAILRRQWVENEKFTFPFVTLPVLIAEDPPPGRYVNDFLRQPLLWIGVGLVTVIHTVRGLHLLYPSIPDIQMSWNGNDYLTVRPWNQLGWIPLNIYPLVIGLSFLLPAEVCFSMWFFYLFVKMEVLVGVLWNLDMPGAQGYGDREFHSLQAYGGGLALVAWTLWTGRTHFRNVFEKAFGGPRASSIDDSDELLPYRVAVFGLLIAYLGIAVWLFLARVNVLLIALSLTTMTLALIVISWVVCQAGLLFMAQPYGSMDIVKSIVGTGAFKIPDMFTMYRFESMFFYDTREMLAPSVLMAAKTGEVGSFRVRPLMVAIVATVLIGFGVSLYASLQLPYYNGGGNSLNNEFTYRWAPERPLSFLGGAASLPYRGYATNLLNVAAGFMGVLGMLLLRAQFNIGIHPIGFLCATVYAMNMLWVSIFIGWVFKTLISRYGGMKGYLGGMPFFLGLVLGDVLNGILWIALGYATKVGYAVLPG
ncbi:MAG: DUF6785 family protein [Capsulimonadales bacterium]|nr:DUF6785 family protein [Capsulimonadales bacterium]